MDFEKSKLYPRPVIIPVYNQSTGKFICGHTVTEGKHQQILDNLNNNSGKKMTDLEFAKYLSKMLLNSGEDCCSKCAFNRKDDVCDNHKRSEALDCPLDADLCFVGLKRYAETQQTD